jgi:hypothetical protein
MKNLLILCALLSLSTPSMLAQDARGGQLRLEGQATAKAREQKPATVRPAKYRGEVQGRRVVYGGYLTEFFRADRKRQFLSLRAPLNEATDGENVAVYPGAENVQGFIFFSFKF